LFDDDLLGLELYEHVQLPFIQNFLFLVDQFQAFNPVSLAWISLPPHPHSCLQQFSPIAQRGAEQEMYAVLWGPKVYSTHGDLLIARDECSVFPIWVTVIQFDQALMVNGVVNIFKAKPIGFQELFQGLVAIHQH
jgi:hypothetical protein